MPTIAADWRGDERWRSRSSAAASPGSPFGDLDDFISQEELRALSDRYKRIAGYSIEQPGTPGPAPAK
jgi:hypothetical protein